LAAPDTVRVADLETLLRLTSRDLAQSIAQAQEDAEAVARLTFAMDVVIHTDMAHAFQASPAAPQTP